MHHAHSGRHEIFATASASTLTNQSAKFEVIRVLAWRSVSLLAPAAAIHESTIAVWKACSTSFGWSAGAMLWPIALPFVSLSWKMIFMRSLFITSFTKTCSKSPAGLAIPRGRLPQAAWTPPQRQGIPISRGPQCQRSCPPGRCSQHDAL